MPAIAILVSPIGEIWFESYGPKSLERSKATPFTTARIAEKAALNRFGRGEPGFWASERSHVRNCCVEYQGWSYRIEELKDTPSPTEPEEFTF